MDYQDQINNFLNMQNLISAQQGVYLQKEQMTEEKGEAKEEEGGEDVGLAGLLGEFGVSNASEFLSKYGVESMNSLMKDFGLSEETVGKVGDVLKNGLNNGDLNPDSFFDFIRGNLRDLASNVIPENIKGVASNIKGVVSDVKGVVSDVKGVASDIKAGGLSKIEGMASDIKAGGLSKIEGIASDFKAPLSSSGLKSSSGFNSMSINADDLDIGALSSVEKNIFYKSIDKIGEGIKSRVSSMRSQKVGESDIDDLLFKSDLASDADPLSIAGAPSKINLFSPSGEFVGNTLARGYNQEKLLQSLPDITEGIKPPAPPELSENLVPKVGQAVEQGEGIAEKVGAGVAEKEGAEIAGEGAAEAVGAGLDATGILAPIGAAIGIGSAIYSAFKGVEDLFKTHSTYTPPAPIATLFQAT